ncbi:hypothetical protein Godav_006382 [Gossypium davidsonii]|uniref:Uncharacterized protein n=1 Tax=Gossypium davidsonii TaxID=34287 RepID=A0A7J8S3J2_GOSDV|nr:hypothetical protein [Gossypium davidsonii]
MAIRSSSINGSLELPVIGSKNHRSNLTTKEKDEEQEPERTVKIEESNLVVGVGLEDVGGSSFEIFIDGKLFTDLSGLQPDLWKDPKWDVLSFLIQYLLAFGIVFAEKNEILPVLESKAPLWSYREND